MGRWLFALLCFLVGFGATSSADPGDPWEEPEARLARREAEEEFLSGYPLRTRVQLRRALGVFLRVSDDRLPVPRSQLFGLEEEDLIGHAVRLEAEDDRVLELNPLVIENQKEVLEMISGAGATAHEASIADEIARLEAEMELVRSGKRPLMYEEEIQAAIRAEPWAALADRIDGRWESTLVEAIRTHDRIEVIADHDPKEEVRVWILEGDAVAEFAAAIGIVEPKYGVTRTIFCSGDLRLSFSGGPGPEIEVALIHGLAIRWEGGPWGSDPDLTASSSLALDAWARRWLGVGFPQEPQSPEAMPRDFKETEP